MECRAGERLAKSGYEAQYATPREPGVFERLGLEIQNRLARFSFRRRRYGIRLWFAIMFSNRFGLVSMRKKAQLAKNAIDRQHLK